MSGRKQRMVARVILVVCGVAVVVTLLVSLGMALWLGWQEWPVGTAVFVVVLGAVLWAVFVLDNARRRDREEA